MTIFLGTIFFFLSFILVSLILLQESKGGGIAAMGGAAMDNVMGGKNPLRRMTAYLFGIFVIMTLVLNYHIKNRDSGAVVDEGLVKKEKTEKVVPTMKAAGDAEVSKAVAKCEMKHEHTDKCSAPVDVKPETDKKTEPKAKKE